MKAYSDLLKKFSHPSQISYEELLCTTEWMTKRDKIVKRDNCKCSKCGEGATLYVSGLGSIWLREDHKKDYGWFKDGDDFIEKEVNWVKYFHEEADRPTVYKFITHIIFYQNFHGDIQTKI